MRLSLEESVNVIKLFYECFENATIAARLYTQRFPQSRRLSRGIFIRLARRFRTTGSVVHPTYRRQGCRRTEENIINVLAYVNFDPQISIRTISGDLGISRSVVHRILQEHRYNTIFKKIKISQCT